MLDPTEQEGHEEVGASPLPHPALGPSAGLASQDGVPTPQALSEGALLAEPAQPCPERGVGPGWTGAWV